MHVVPLCVCMLWALYVKFVNLLQEIASSWGRAMFSGSTTLFKPGLRGRGPHVLRPRRSLWTGPSPRGSCWRSRALTWNRKWNRGTSGKWWTLLVIRKGADCRQEQQLKNERRVISVVSEILKAATLYKPPAQCAVNGMTNQISASFEVVHHSLNLCYPLVFMSSGCRSWRISIVKRERRPTTYWSSNDWYSNKQLCGARPS